MGEAFRRIGAASAIACTSSFFTDVLLAAPEKPVTEPPSVPVENPVLPKVEAIQKHEFSCSDRRMPSMRIPPQYPDACVEGAADNEAVKVQYTINEFGLVNEAIVIETTNSCFDESAVKSIRRWKHRPYDAEKCSDHPQYETVETVITFRKAE